MSAVRCRWPSIATSSTTPTSNGFDLSANGLFSPGQQGYLADNGLPMDQDLDTARWG